MAEVIIENNKDFDKNRRKIQQATEITIGEDVTEIPTRGLEYCNAEKLVIPKNVKKIGSAALQGSAWTHVTVPKEAKVMQPDQLFIGCRDIKEINYKGKKYNSLEKFVKDFE